MSICPSNDIHSVFVDGEFPEEFKDNKTIFKNVITRTIFNI